ncbi:MULTISPECIES: hypothetical protein [Marivita]|uniref:Uncharacterized protein n=1 Tax=Marivita cryptomonadis TaxID=505252 RepID=A0A9Q2NZ37_9RHOB|nr:MULTISPECIES: hypothetical protein [Marivita]MCR9168032.1 hypothetical protein [Paracoccaceae bacterium]MBM2321412.1 hypothetical protein [Marivita cryptomonadis]MBM2330993.1 hypothetical protein [Marivita cryptomonadis]MBM2340579.1 hypothetical protein [Marivita cryptomonadis]MBM2345241.1 hypothetical protein [Marivita cryptomonadis]
MFLELIAVIVAGIAGAGVMMLIARTLGDRVPNWLIPVAAGAAMLGTTISSEYSWYSRTAEALPEGVEVVQTAESTAFYRPWTYLAPYTNRFIALDTGNVRANTEDAALFMADVYFFRRWSTVQAVELMVNCSTGQRADPAFGDGGDPVWRDAVADDPIISGVCDRG